MIIIQEGRGTSCFAKQLGRKKIVGKAIILDKDRCMECGACGNNCASALINSMITGGEPSCGCSGKSEMSGCC